MAYHNKTQRGANCVDIFMDVFCELWRSVYFSCWYRRVDFQQLSHSVTQSHRCGRPHPPVTKRLNMLRTPWPLPGIVSNGCITMFLFVKCIMYGHNQVSMLIIDWLVLVTREDICNKHDVRAQRVRSEVSYMLESVLKFPFWCHGVIIRDFITRRALECSTSLAPFWYTIKRVTVRSREVRKSLNRFPLSYYWQTHRE